MSCDPGRVFFYMANQRVIVFFDGQNLYHAAKDAWGPDPPTGPSPYAWPSYDVEKLAKILVERVPGRVLAQTRFYTGVPDPYQGPKEKFWHGFWTNKLRVLASRGIYVYKGRVNPGGQEKGVDVSLAIDLVRLTYEQAYQVAIVVSQDWDFGPAVRLAKQVAQGQGRMLVFESAFPLGPGGRSRRGIPGTVWVPIDKEAYDACYDPTDYRAE